MITVGFLRFCFGGAVWRVGGKMTVIALSISKPIIVVECTAQNRRLHRNVPSTKATSRGSKLAIRLTAGPLKVRATQAAAATESSVSTDGGLQEPPEVVVFFFCLVTDGAWGIANLIGVIVFVLWLTEQDWSSVRLKRRKVNDETQKSKLTS